MHIPGVAAKKKNKKMDPKKMYTVTWLDRVNKEKVVPQDEISCLTRITYCEEKKDYNMSMTFDPFNQPEGGDGSNCSACCTIF